jgi:hypothetical protein
MVDGQGLKALRLLRLEAEGKAGIVWRIALWLVLLESMSKDLDGPISL